MYEDVTFWVNLIQGPFGALIIVLAVLIVGAKVGWKFITGVLKENQKLHETHFEIFREATQNQSHMAATLNAVYADIEDLRKEIVDIKTKLDSK